MSATAGRTWRATCRAARRDTVQPFLTLQYLYGLARAERAEADQLMQAVEDKAASLDGL